MYTATPYIFTMPDMFSPDPRQHCSAPTTGLLPKKAAGYVFTRSPSTLFSTNNRTVAEESGFTLSDPDYSVRKILFTKGCLVNGLENGMYGVKDGGHCIILFSAQYGFYDSYVYNIPKLSALAYEIWVDRVIKKDE